MKTTNYFRHTEKKTWKTEFIVHQSFKPWVLVYFQRQKKKVIVITKQQESFN